MLLKLFKHEFAATWRIMLILNAALLGMGVVGYAVMWFFAMQYKTASQHGNYGSGFFAVLSFLLFFVITLVTIHVIAKIYLLVRYYRSLYTPEGYLTFTLPATTTEIMHAKILTGVLWNLILQLLTITAVVLPVTGITVVSAEDLREFVRIPADFFDLITFDDLRLVPVFILLSAASAVSSILVFYFCITVGQLWAKHKSIGAVLCYLAVALVNRIITFFLSLGSGYSRLFFFGYLANGDTFSRAYGRMLTGTLVYSIVLIVLYYLGCVLITKKQVNLD